MKIVAVNGSHRGKRGYGHFLIGKLFEGAKSAGAECEEIVLAEKNVKRCTGCFTCQKKERLFKCIFDGQDDAREIFEKMREADIIIFSTPVYVFHMSSLLKNLFDRYPFTSNAFEFAISEKGLFFHHIDKEVCSKPFLLLICQDNLEFETHKSIIEYFKIYSKFMDAPCAGTLVRRSGGVAGHGNLEKTKEFPELQEIYSAFVKAGAELAVKGKITRKTQKRASKPIIKLPPFVHLMAKLKVFRKDIIKKAAVSMGEP